MLRMLTTLTVTTLLAGCTQTDSPAPPSASSDTPPANSPAVPSPKSGESDSENFPVRMTSEHLPNPVQIHSKVISGGLPEGDAAFRELADLGVKTVITVDGATPDVKTAAKYGLRYVHLPHGYDGIPDRRAKELAKAVRELDGMVYIHCHHGKHRSPAAASVACVTAGMVPSSQAVAILELAGTNPGYRGLYQSAREAEAMDAALLDELNVEFREVVDVPPMAQAMTLLGHTHDHLKLIRAAGWKTPIDHPDLEPAHEALLLREHFTELLRTDEVRQQPDDFQMMLRDSEDAAQQLEDALEHWAAADTRSEPPEKAALLADRIAKNCKSCHVKYRDVPLSEK